MAAAGQPAVAEAALRGGRSVSHPTSDGQACQDRPASSALITRELAFYPVQAPARADITGCPAWLKGSDAMYTRAPAAQAQHPKTKLPCLLPLKEFIITGGTVLARPPPPPEAAPEGYVAPKAALTFRVLDENKPQLYVPNVALEPAITFFR